MATNDNGTAGRERPLNFLEEIIEDHINSVDGRIHTRFPPEPNGYLHIGHAKSICLNFGLAERYGGLCNLRFDDTNPVKEDQEYVDGIMDSVRWLGFDWKFGNEIEGHISRYRGSITGICRNRGESRR